MFDEDFATKPRKRVWESGGFSRRLKRRGGGGGEGFLPAVSIKKLSFNVGRRASQDQTGNRFVEKPTNFSQGKAGTANQDTPKRLL